MTTRKWGDWIVGGGCRGQRVATELSSKENREFFGGGGSIFTSWGRQTTGFRDVVARTSDTLVRLRRQNQDRDLALGEIYPTGVNFDEDGV